MTPSAGYINERVYVYEPEVIETQFGDDTLFNDTPEHTMWANVQYQRGSQILRQGDVMMANTIVVTSRTHSYLTERCRLGWNGNIYRITSFNSSKHDNSVTITAEKIEQ